MLAQSEVFFGKAIKVIVYNTSHNGLTFLGFEDIVEVSVKSIEDFVEGSFRRSQLSSFRKKSMQ